ncbi:MAG TPA: RluA family pseudouridine synthase [Candidatus Acidoferrales bacterium]|nr:RluA family pseudouridine synthase [Candidatus Acidoferrales bacterium]
MKPESAAGERASSAQNRARSVTLIVAEGEGGQRLDRFLSEHITELSRTRIQALVEHGRVRVNGGTAKRSQRVETGDSVVMEIPAPAASGAKAEALPLEILYEDPDVAVVNKPAGMIVHPGAGVNSGTVVNALLHEFGERGELSSIGGELRPGIVHRLDRETSGALLIAKNDAAHRALVEQFSGRKVEKRYVALVHGSFKENSGRIELPVARDLHRRTRMTTRRREGREARTDWRMILRLDGYSFLEADLHTGRTHQIRVHFSAIGHPVVGDTLYGAPREVKAGSQTLPRLARNFLHAARLKFAQPSSGKAIEIRAPLPYELADYLRELGRATGVPSVDVDAALRPYL